MPWVYLHLSCCVLGGLFPAESSLFFCFQLLFFLSCSSQLCLLFPMNTAAQLPSSGVVGAFTHTAAGLVSISCFLWSLFLWCLVIHGSCWMLKAQRWVSQGIVQSELAYLPAARNVQQFGNGTWSNWRSLWYFSSNFKNGPFKVFKLRWVAATAAWEALRAVSSGEISLGNLREGPRLSGNLGMQFPGPQLGCCLAPPEGRARWLPACR